MNKDEIQELLYNLSDIYNYCLYFDKDALYLKDKDGDYINVYILNELLNKNTININYINKNFKENLLEKISLSQYNTIINNNFINTDNDSKINSQIYKVKILCKNFILNDDKTFYYNSESLKKYLNNKNIITLKELNDEFKLNELPFDLFNDFKKINVESDFYYNSKNLIEHLEKFNFISLIKLKSFNLKEIPQDIEIPGKDKNDYIFEDGSKCFYNKNILEKYLTENHFFSETELKYKFGLDGWPNSLLRSDKLNNMFSFDKETNIYYIIVIDIDIIRDQEKLDNILPENIKPKYHKLIEKENLENITYLYKGEFPFQTNEELIESKKRYYKKCIVQLFCKFKLNDKLYFIT